MPTFFPPFPRRRLLRVAARIAAALLCVLALGGPAFALNPALGLEDYNHTVWTEKEGVPGLITCMAQTPDGWLWLGAAGGIYRFDGLRFERYTLPGRSALWRTRISQLRAEANGDLWIAYAAGGLSVLHANGELEDLAEPGGRQSGQIGALAVDTDGSVWVLDHLGIRHYQHHAWHDIAAPESDWQTVDSRSLLLDQHGRLWASNERHVYLLNRALGRFEPWRQADVHGSLIQSPDGRLWAASRDRVQLIDAPAPALARAAFHNQAESRWGGQFDRDGNLWALKCPNGLCLLAHAGDTRATLLTPSTQFTGRLDQPWQLSSPGVNNILEDREGNIWIATQGGLDRFRDNKLIQARMPAGAGLYSIARDTGGTVWAAEPDTGRLWQLSATAPPRAAAGNYRVLGNDRDGALLLAGVRAIERRYRGAVSSIPLPPGADGKPRDLNVLGMLDDGKVLWMAALETGLMGWRDGKWLPRAAFNLPPRIFISAAGGPGQLWLNLDDGSIVLYDNGRQTRYDGSMLGMASGIFPGAELAVSGDKGMAVLIDGHFRMLQAADPEVLQNISGLVLTASGDRWFNGSKGVVHVRDADWRAAVSQPGHLLRYELLNALEGYPGRAAQYNRLPSALMGGDGQLWFLATGGIVRTDPRPAPPNRVRPVVEIQRVSTAQFSYRGTELGSLSAPGRELTLPPGSQAFHIQFTAPGLRRPESMRFQYRLEGVDAGWQNADGQRTAFYTNVGPGAYRFTVRAINEDGVAGTAEAALQLRVLPTSMQTGWFKLLCAALLALLLYGLYRYRLRVVSAGLARAMTVRMEERERIARMLHDTILQSVHVIILRLQLLSNELPGDSSVRLHLLTWIERAERTVARGRDQVHQLRSEAEMAGDVPGVIEETGRMLEELYPQTLLQLSVAGTPQPLRDGVADEVGELAREALRNAFRHSGASVVEASIEFQVQHLLLCIRDNGRGIEQQVLDAGQRPGHWGLTGMRERADRLGGVLTVASTPGVGSAVTLALPAARAYLAQQKAPRTGLPGRLRRLLWRDTPRR